MWKIKKWEGGKELRHNTSQNRDMEKKKKTHGTPLAIQTGKKNKQTSGPP